VLRFDKFAVVDCVTSVTSVTRRLLDTTTTVRLTQLTINRKLVIH